MRTTSRMNCAPWVLQVFNGRTPTREEIVWLLDKLMFAQELEDEYALRTFQATLTETLGTIVPAIGKTN